MEEQKRRCSKCKLEKIISEFCTYNRSWCKECAKVYRKEQSAKWYAKPGSKAKMVEIALRHKNKLKEIIFVRKREGCIVCGYNKCMPSIDLHHVNEEGKRFCISNVLVKGVDIETLKEEIKKCVPVCKNCHGEHHEGLINIRDYLSAK